MKVWKATFVADVVLSSWPMTIRARAADPAPRIGAPAFSATDTQGKPRTLAEFRGKRVVLEWHNQSCPFVVTARSATSTGRRRHPTCS